MSSRVRLPSGISITTDRSSTRALAAFALERYRPRLICIETSPDFKEWFDDYFAERGYERVDRYDRYDYVNSYYAPATQR